MRVNEADHVRASRARIAGAAIADRRALERALHDGVQQDLIAISVRLQLARELVSNDVAATLELLEELRDETRAALDRVRALAGDVYPAILDARGLAEALREEVRASGHAVRLGAAGLDRCPPVIEATAFLCCREALVGAAPGTSLEITVHQDADAMHVEVAGGSWDTTAARDLVEAAGGSLRAETGRVTATLPL